MPDSSRRQSVLLVDDDKDLRAQMRKTLERIGLFVQEAASPENARFVLQRFIPDALVVDIAMAGTDHLAFLRELRTNDRTRLLPVIVLSFASGGQQIVRAMRLGASDFLGKPVDPEVLAAKLEVHLRYRDVVMRLERRNELLSKLAALDELTGLYNRRSLLEALPLDLARSWREKTPMAVMLIDADHFKKVNDSLGHIAGDETLIGLARRLETGLREADILARYGGEEFCAVIPHIGKKELMEAAERVRRAVADEPIELLDSNQVALTVSIGAAWISPLDAQDSSARRILRAADEALYEAKSQGRNRVVFRRVSEVSETVSDIPPRGERTPLPPEVAHDLASQLPKHDDD